MNQKRALTIEGFPAGVAWSIKNDKRLYSATWIPWGSGVINRKSTNIPMEFADK